MPNVRLKGLHRVRVKLASGKRSLTLLSPSHILFPLSGTT